MSMNDILSDALTRIRNGQRAHLHTVKAPATKLLTGVLNVLEREGFILGWERQGEEKKPELQIKLKYHEGEPVIKELKRVSSPGLRKYASIGTLPKFHNGLGIYILSTSSGVMSDHEARQKNVGGEVLCSVF